MTISVPTAIALDSIYSEGVADKTLFFDNTFHMDYPPLQTYQYNNVIYQNTSLDALIVPLYDDGGDYTINQIVFKPDDPLIPEVGSVSKITASDGTFIKQPSNYVPYDTGFDYTTWDNRYSKLYDIPATHDEDLGYSLATAAYGFVFSSDGTKALSAGYVITSGGNANYTVCSHSFTDGFDLATGVRTIAAFAVNSAKVSIDVSNDGKNVYSINSAGIWHETIPVAWEYENESLLWSSSSITGDRITFNKVDTAGYAAGEIMFVAEGNIIKRYFLSTPWLISTAVHNETRDMSSDSAASITGITFSTNGTRMYIGRMYDAVYQYDLGSEYSMFSMTLSGMNGGSNIFGRRFEELIWMGDGNDGVNVIYRSGYGQIYRCTMPIAHDVSVMYRTILPIQGTFKVGSQWNIYSLDLVNGEYIFTSTILDDTRTEVVIDTNTVNFYSLLDYESIDEMAYLFQDTSTTYTSWNARTVIVEATGVFVRTHLDRPLEYSFLGGNSYAMVVVISPADLTDFAPIGATNDFKPFDGKNYTSATTDTGTMIYEIVGERAFDTVALGNVKAEHVSIEFISTDETLITPISVDISTDRDAHGHLEPWYTTLIYYSTDAMEENPISTVILPAGSSVRITLTGLTGLDGIELATIMLGMSAEAGFTNLELKNTYKDFSTFQYDTFGNVDYVDRAKVSRYSGSVDMRIENYDMTDRLMASLGQNLVMVNGSDGLNNPTNSRTIFAATQKIGRFVAFDQRTVVKDADMDVMATYTFTLEEIV